MVNKLVGIAIMAIAINAASAMDRGLLSHELKPCAISHLHLAGTDTDELLQDVGQENCTTYIPAELVRANKRATAAIRTLGADGDNLLGAVIVGGQQYAGLTVGEFATVFESAFLHVSADIQVPGPANAELRELFKTQELVDLQILDAMRPWFDILQAQTKDNVFDVELRSVMMKNMRTSHPFLFQSNDFMGLLYDFVTFAMINH